MAALEAEHLDPLGDINLTVKNGEKVVKLKVSSHAMRLASPVWKAMLTGGFVETFSKDITLEDDDPQTLLIVLHAAHLQYRKLPESLHFSQLVRLAILCDKYDTVAVLRPSKRAWISPHEPCVLSPVFDWFSVAWAFGYEEEFTRVAKNLVRTLKKNDAGQYVNGGGHIIKETIAGQVLERIICIRRETIEKMVSVLYETLETQTENHRCPGSGTYEHEARMCQSLRLGSLFLALRSLTLFPQKKAPDEIKKSINDFMNTWKQQSIDYLAIVPGYYHRHKGKYVAANYGGHEGCELKKVISGKLEDIVNLIPSPVTDEDIQRLKEQAEK